MLTIEHCVARQHWHQASCTAYSEWPIAISAGYCSNTISPLVRKSTRRMLRLSQNTVHVTSCTNKVCLNFILQGDPLWRQCIDCCLVSGVPCATHDSSHLCRNVNADSMRFTLCWGIHLIHNFLNNSCSVTILYNKEWEICRKWLLSSLFVKQQFSIMHSCTSSTKSSIMMMASHCAPHAHVVDLL